MSQTATARFCVLFEDELRAAAAAVDAIAQASAAGTPVTADMVRDHLTLTHTALRALIGYPSDGAVFLTRENPFLRRAEVVEA